jgi:N-acetylglucosamine kinase-like BadF-type ATPase
MRELDGRTARTPLTPKTLKFLQIDSPTQLVNWAYATDQLRIDQIASLSQLCGDPQLIDCTEMVEIVTTAVHELIEAYDAVIFHMRPPENRTLQVVLIGGLFRMEGQFANQVIRSILNRTPRSNVIFPTMSPAEGAVRIAMQGNRYLPQSVFTLVNPTLT